MADPQKNDLSGIFQSLDSLDSDAMAKVIEKIARREIPRFLLNGVPVNDAAKSRHKSWLKMLEFYSGK